MPRAGVEQEGSAVTELDDAQLLEQQSRQFPPGKRFHQRSGRQRPALHSRRAEEKSHGN